MNFLFTKWTARIIFSSHYFICGLCVWCSRHRDKKWQKSISPRGVETANIRYTSKRKVTYSKGKIYILISFTVWGRKVIMGFDGKNVASFCFK